MTHPALNAVGEYQAADNSAIAYADPHELILRLLNGAVERISQARGAISRGETAAKAESISKAVMIVGGLEGCVNHQAGGELAENLSALYQYMGIRLAEANIHDDIAKLNEVTDLLLQIKSAWEKIPEYVQSASA